MVVSYMEISDQFVLMGFIKRISNVNISSILTNYRNLVNIFAIFSNHL